MKFLPRTVQSLVTQSPDAARVRDTLTSAVQPTLNFLNTYFAAAADGSLRVVSNVALRAASVVGTFTVAGTSNLQNTNINPGQLYIQPAAGSTDALTIVPTTAGQAMKITNIGNTQINVGATADGTFTALSFSAVTNGFASILKCGHYWNSSMAASSAQFTGDCVYNQNNSGLGFAQFRHKFQRYASIVGFALSNTGAASGDHYIQYYRNGTKLADFKAGTGANGDFWGTHAKGTYAFSPGDTLTTSLATTSAGNFQGNLFVTVEMSA